MKSGDPSRTLPSTGKPGSLWSSSSRSELVISTRSLNRLGGILLGHNTRKGTLNRAGSTLACSHRASRTGSLNRLGSRQNSWIISGLNQSGTSTPSSHTRGQATGGGSKFKKGLSLVTTEGGFFTGSTGTSNTFDSNMASSLENRSDHFSSRSLSSSNLG